jgi:hypothetical protein
LQWGTKLLKPTLYLYTLSLLETRGPNNIGDVALYTKTSRLSPPLNVSKALAKI